MMDYRRIFRYVFFVAVVLLVVGVEISTARGGRGGGSRGGYRGGYRGSSYRGGSRSGSIAWKAAVVGGIYFGSRRYSTRRRYYSGQAPQVCVNYMYTMSNSSSNAINYHGKFVCPMADQKDDLDYCCGKEGQQRCCKFGDDPGRVAGLVIGLLILFAIIGVTIFCCCKYQNRRKKSQGTVKHTNNFPMKPTPVPTATGYPNGAGTYPPPAGAYPPPAGAYPPAAGGYPPAGGYPQPGAPQYMPADTAAPPYPGAVPPSYEKSQELPYTPNPTGYPSPYPAAGQAPYPAPLPTSYTAGGQPGALPYSADPTTAPAYGFSDPNAPGQGYSALPGHAPQY